MSVEHPSAELWVIWFDEAYGGRSRLTKFGGTTKFKITHSDFWPERRGRQVCWGKIWWPIDGDRCLANVI